MATKHDFIVKNGLRVRKSLTVDSDVTIAGALNVAGNVTGSYAGFDSDFNVALDSAALNGTGLSYNSTTNTLSIADTGVDSATYGSASLVPVLKINAQGQIDSAGTVSVAGVSSTAFDSASHTLTINTADGGSFDQIVQTKMPGTSGSFGSAALVPVITVNQYGLVDSINEVSVAGVSTFDFDSATGQLTIGTADGGSFSQVLTLDPYTTTDATFGSVAVDSAVVSQVSFSTSNEHLNYEEGAVWYDTTHKTLNYWGDDSAVIHEIGIEEHQRVYNNTGGPIAKGTPLYYSGNYDPGGTPAVPTVGKADATDVNAYNAQGLAAGNIPNNSYGYVILSGLVEGVDTSALSAGQNFFVGLTPGAVQNSSPLYPNYPMCLGWVVKSDATNGSLLVNQQNHSVNSFRVRTSAHVGDDLIVGGNLTVTGTQTITSTENVQIGGNIQYLNAGDTIGEANTTFVGSGLDDAFFSGHYNGDSSSKSFYVKIDATGTPDTFEWGFDSSVGTEATGISITGNDQLLDSAYGINIKFAATTGHTTGDKWSGTATAVDTDTGFFSNRNTGDGGDGYTHVGFFFDASEDTWRLLSAYDSEPEAPINLNSPSLQYGDMRAGNVTFGNVTVSGTVDGRDVAADGAKLDGIESGATADQTKADIDALNINADQVDGLEASQFLRSDVNDTSTGVITFNGGIAFNPNGSNFEINRDTNSRVIFAYNNNGTREWAVNYNSNGDIDFDRVSGSGNFKIDNNLVWHAGNDGSGSGLDADTVDGLEASQFLRSDTSDAMTGTLTVSGDIGVGTTSPSNKLHVKGTGNNIATFETSLTSDMAIELKNSQGSMFFGLGGGEEFAVGTDADLNGVNSKFVIKSSGNVGIGTTSPDKIFHVNGEARFDNEVYFQAAGTAIRIHTDGSDRSLIHIHESAIGSTATDTWYLGHGSDNRLFWHSRGTNTEVFTINQTNGFTGILDSTPKTQLDVNGLIRANSYLRRDFNEEPCEFQANGALGRWVAMTSSTITVAAAFFNTDIYEEDPLTGTTKVILTASPNANTTFTASAGKIYYTNGKPVNMVGENNNQAIAPLSDAGRYFGFISSRYQPQTIYAYAVGGNVTVNVYQNKGITGNTPDYTFDVAANNVGSTAIAVDSATYIIEVTGGMAVLTRAASAGDKDILRPASRIRYKGDQSFASSTPKSIFSYNDVSSYNSIAFWDTDLSEPIILAAIGDGSGGDTQTGIGLQQLADNYLIPHNLEGYAVHAPYPDTDIRISYYNGSTWTTHATHSLSGTIFAPDTYSVGNLDTGGSATVNSGNRCIWISANNPFFLKVNDDSDTEYDPVGWLSQYYSMISSSGNLSGSQARLDSLGVGVSPPTTSGNLDVAGSILIGDEVILQESTDRPDLLQITSSTSTWGGLQIRNSSNEGRWSFMTDGSNAGLYDDENNKWHIYLTENANTELRYNGGAEARTQSGYFFAVNQMRAPIYYESANTAYYFDGGNTGDSIRVAGDIVAFYSDERLKDFQGRINGALDKVLKINGYYYTENERAKELGYNTGKTQVGVSAQEVEAVLPEIIKDAPIGHGYKTVQYERLVPLLIEAIKEQNDKIDRLEAMVEKLINTNKG